MPELLTGQVIDSQYAEVGEIDELRNQVAKLQEENRRLRNDLVRAKADSEVSISAVTSLRAQLNPLYRALRQIFGEIDSVVPADATAGGQPTTVATPSSPVFDPKWDAWKQKLGGTTGPARVIDALLTCGPLNLKQLQAQCKAGQSTMEQATSRLKNLGLIEKRDAKWHLV